MQKFFCKIDLFHVRELLNFFPVIGEDEDGEMIALDAAKVLSIPRKIKSKEVVRRGFMSDFLFQYISNVFRAPQAVIDMIQQMDPARDPGPLAGVTPSTGKELDITLMQLTKKISLITFHHKRRTKSSHLNLR